MGICSPVWFHFSTFSHCFLFLIVLFFPELMIFHFIPLVFPPGLPDYFSFPRLFPLTRNSSTVLNRSGESIHPCFVLDLRVEAFSPSLLSIILAVSFSQMLSIPNLLRDFFWFICLFLYQEYMLKIIKHFPSIYGT